MLLIAVLGVLAVTRAGAQPIACDECVRGDVLIERYGLQPIRPVAPTLAALPLAEPLTQEQYTRVIELRRQTPAFVKLGALDDGDLAAIAAALCHTATGACTTTTSLALRCLADRCAAQVPPLPAGKADVLTEDCHRYSTKRRSSAFGVGLDWGNGIQRSRYPSDGRAWSLGIESRLRLRRRISAVARIDRVAGRDEATDIDRNGNDDVSTGSITRFVAMAGPSFVIDHTRFEDTTRYLRLDVLGGYLATRSQANESGPAAGVDIAFHLSMVRFGARFVKGFGDAIDATVLLVHLGFVVGNVPQLRDDNDCGAESSSRRSRLALGLDLPFGGYGFSEQLGYLASGIGLEMVWRLTRRLDAVTHADLLLFPGNERDRVIHQAALAGLRIDHTTYHSSEDTGFFTTLMAGYTHGAGLTPTTTGSGPVADLSIGWGIAGSEGAANARLHARFGISPDNVEYRAIFLSAGLELRLDPRSWRNRASSW